MKNSSSIFLRAEAESGEARRMISESSAYRGTGHGSFALKRVD